MGSHAAGLALATVRGGSFTTSERALTTSNEHDSKAPTNSIRPIKLSAPVCLLHQS